GQYFDQTAEDARVTFMPELGSHDLKVPAVVSETNAMVIQIVEQGRIRLPAHSRKDDRASGGRSPRGGCGGIDGGGCRGGHWSCSFHCPAQPAGMIVFAPAPHPEW